MNTEWTAFEKRLTLPTSDSLDARIELRASYGVELDLIDGTIASVQLREVTIEQRQWDGGGVERLRLQLSQLLQLATLLDDLREQRGELEVSPPVPLPVDEIEQPDASTGQTFTVDDPQISVD